MQSVIVKLGGIAIVVAFLASALGTVMPTRIASVPQKERIIEGARMSGASNVRIRAAEAEARRAPVTRSSNDQPVVVLVPQSEPENEGRDQEAATGYTGAEPMPQTRFAEADGAAESAEEPEIED